MGLAIKNPWGSPGRFSMGLRLLIFHQFNYVLFQIFRSTVKYYHKFLSIFMSLYVIMLNPLP